MSLVGGAQLAPCGQLARRRTGCSRGRRSASTVRMSGTAERKGEPPLTKQDMIDYIAKGCKPQENWRIGTEHEKFCFRKRDFRPAEYSDIKYLLDGLVTRYGWQPIMEKENIIGAQRDKKSVTLEPGGQLELSGAPLKTVVEVAAELDSHLQEVKTLGSERGLQFLDAGFQPKWAVADTPAMPKGRYEIMRAYMPKVGTMGLDMMFRTCTVQVNLDFESEKDMVEKFRVSLALQPIATALFANSPFVNGKPSGFKSFRSHVWTDVDKARTGDLPFVFEPDFGIERYVEYMMDVPMYFVYRDNKYIDVTGHSFRDYFNGKSAVLPGQRPTLVDFENHLTTAFPEVRLKRYLEMRGADCGSRAAILALPAFWVGILYDSEALSQASALIADWTTQERAFLRANVPRMGLDTPFRGRPLKEVAKLSVAIAKKGLQKRMCKEEVYLEHLEAIVKDGMSVADRRVKEYETKWAKSVDPIFIHHTL